MKTEITFKENLFWYQARVPLKHNGKPFWVMDLNGSFIIIHKDQNDMWRIDPPSQNNIFDVDLEFKDDTKAKKYVENKLLKWIKSIINIRI